MTKHDTQLEYSVHPNSLFYADSAEGYALANAAPTSSSFALRLSNIFRRIVKNSPEHTQANKRHRVDRYERD